MGGAFAAVGSDASAVSWNPAAVAGLQRQEVTFAYADRYAVGLNSSYLAYVLPLRDNQALGLDWHYQGYGDRELDYRRQVFAFGYGYRNASALLRPYVGNTAVGVAARYNAQEASLDARKVMRATGWGWDFGALVPLPWRMRAALVIQDAGGTSVRHRGGISEPLFRTRCRVGVAARPVEGLTVAADRDDEVRVGAEYWLRGMLALRAGLHSELHTPENFGEATSLAVGLGLKYRFAQLDYAYERHPVLAPTHHFGLSLDYAPHVVTIKSAAIKPSPVYRSLYRHYEESDFVDVVLGNASEEPVRASVRVMLPRVMRTPHQETVTLPPLSNREFAFGVTFDPELFNTPEAKYDQFVIPTVEVVHTRNRKEEKEAKQLDRVYVAGKGKLSWGVPGMVAAFVTPEDLAVAELARGVVQRYDAVLTAKFDRSNLGKAVLVFDALGAYKIRYQADQKTPFASIAADRTVFDTVQYPSELLAKPQNEETKVGDCDDLTVLYASLLENLSIDTALLEANEPGRGHIFLMFDSGLTPDDAEDHFVSRSEYVAWAGRIWIPVETTMMGYAFADAWRTGAGEYARLKPNGMIGELYVQEWLARYKPATLAPVRAAVPQNAWMDSLLARDLEFFDQRVDRIALAAVTSLNTPDGLYDAGATYLRMSHLEKALEMFDRALALAPEHADALNGRGVVLTRQGRYEEALACYRRALQQQDDNGVRMNVALTYYLMGERQTADQVYQEVARADDTYAELFDFLAGVGAAQEDYDLAVGYLRQGQLEAAAELLQRALEADPQFADAVNALGVVLTRQGKYQAALERFERAVQLDPQQLGFRLNVALVHYLLGDRQRADALYQQIVAVDDAYAGLFDFLAGLESADENYRVATAYMRQGEFAPALERLDRALEADPKMGEAYNARGVVLANLGRYDEAFSMFEAAAAAGAEQAGVRLNMAIIRYLQGRRQEAAAIYEQVVRMEPSYDGFMDFLREDAGTDGTESGAER